MKLMGRETIIGADCGQAVEAIEGAIEGANTNYLHEDEIDGGKSIQSSKLDEVVGSDEMSSGFCKEDKEEEDVDCVKDEEFPEGSVPDERPHKRIHSFYFVKFPYYQDPILRTKVEQACELVRKKGRLRHDITEEIKNKTEERLRMERELQALTGSHEWTWIQGMWKWLPRRVKYHNEERLRMERELQALTSSHEWTRIQGMWKWLPKRVKYHNEERLRMERELQALTGSHEWTWIHGMWKWLPKGVKYHNVNTSIEENQLDLCSSEEDLNDSIRSLHHRIQHKSKNLIEEKQLLRVIKQLEGTREKVIAREISQKNLRARYPSPIKVNVQTVIKMQSEVHKNIKFLEKEQKTIDKVIKSLLKEQTTMSQKQAEGHEILYELWKEHEEENASFYKNHSLLNYVKDLAAKRDIAALQKLSHRENEKFMSLWSHSKAVRDEYGKKILSSLDSRQLSIDGRIRNPDENPLILEAPTSVVSEKELAKLIFDTIESIVLPLSSLMRLKGHVQKK